MSLIKSAAACLHDQMDFNGIFVVSFMFLVLVLCLGYRLLYRQFFSQFPVSVASFLNEENVCRSVSQMQYKNCWPGLCTVTAENVSLQLKGSVIYWSLAQIHCFAISD